MEDITLTDVCHVFQKGEPEVGPLKNGSIIHIPKVALQLGVKPLATLPFPGANRIGEARNSRWEIPRK